MSEKARFSQSRNDMYWSIYAGDAGFVRWTGYDDDYWWKNIAPSKNWQKRTAKDGRVFTLNPVTCDVTIEPAPAASQKRAEEKANA